MHQVKTTRLSSLVSTTSVALLSLFLLIQHANAQVVTVGSTAPEGQATGSVTDRTVVFDLYYPSSPVRPSSRGEVAFQGSLPTLFGRPNFCPIPAPAAASFSMAMVPIPISYRLDSPPELYNPNTKDSAVSNCSENNANWVLRNWQIRTGATGGKVQLELFKSGATNQAQVVSAESVQEAQPNQLNTFPIERPITEDEFKQVEGFGVSVIGTGPEPFAAQTDKPNPELGLANVPGNFSVGSLFDISTLDTTKQPNVALTLESDIDHDGIRDSIDEDADNDGTPNATDNCRWISNANQKDANKNGVGTACDNVEPWEQWRDQLLASDNDRDGVPFNREMKIKTDVCDNDSDDDGISDGQELKHHTKPTSFDTDHDHLSDGLESGVNKPLPASTFKGNCTDSRPQHATWRTVLTTNPRRFRSDRDPKTKTNPLRADTDRDGKSDGKEDKNQNGRVDPGESNPRRPDR